MEKNKYALLIIDMLNDFVTGSLGFEGAKKIIKPNQELIDLAHKNNIPVIYACDSHLNDIDFEFTHWDKHALKDDYSSQIIDELKPTKKDYIILKRRYSAFFRTDLDLLCHELDVNTLIISGVQTHICVQHTCGDAFMNSFKTILAIEATSSSSKEDYNNAIKYMKDIYGTKLLPNKEIINLFK